MLNRADDNIEEWKKILYLDGSNLCFASKKMKDTEDIVKIAINNSGWNLQYASERLRSKVSIVKLACSNRPDAVQFAKGKAAKSKSVALMVVKQNGEYLKYLPNWKDNEEIVIESLKNSYIDANTLVYASDRLRGNLDIILLSIKKCGVASIIFATREFINKKKNALAICNLYPEVITYLPKKYFKDKEFIKLLGR